MKNTLFISLLAFSSAAFAAESYTLNTLEAPDSGANAELHGWAQKLDSTHLTQLELPDKVNLNSVTIQAADSGNYTGSVKLAVYSSSTISGDTFLGISTNTIVCNTDTPWTAKATYTFNFSGVTLDSSTSYSYYFVSAESTKDSQTQSYFRVAMSPADRIEGEAFYVNSGSKDWESIYSPYATYKVSDVAAVPEPATATLSLLALAGLAARRRRK